jgi:hypothetical protein
VASSERRKANRRAVCRCVAASKPSGGVKKSCELRVAFGEPTQRLWFFGRFLLPEGSFASVKRKPAPGTARQAVPTLPRVRETGPFSLRRTTRAGSGAHWGLRFCSRRRSSTRRTINGPAQLPYLPYSSLHCTAFENCSPLQYLITGCHGLTPPRLENLATYLL